MRAGRKYRNGHLRCGRCGHEWLPRNPAVEPQLCPRCGRALAAEIGTGGP